MSINYLYIFLRYCVAVNIIKSRLDTGEYHLITLKNDINVLIVQNDAFKKASCALTVRVGFRDDPDEFPGLAHLLEHVLFLGTSKYPKEGEFYDYLSQHGGTRNAHTEDEHTTFYFDIDEEYLEHAADMFSQFFISPLIKGDALEREINAVHSEFLNALNDDSFRQVVVRSDLMSEKKVGIGNETTLRKLGILDAVVDFWRNKYSSRMMTVVICGNSPVYDLKKVALLFEEITHLPVEKDVDNSPVQNVAKLVFKDEYLSKVVHYRPTGNMKQLTILTAISPLHQYFKTNPLRYISEILVEGGLVSKLQDEQLVLDLRVEYHFTTYTEMWIRISLTEKGFDMYQDVLSIVHSAILGLKADREEYERLRKISLVRFKYIDVDTSISTAMKLSLDMQRYPIRHVLSHGSLYEVFDSKILNDVIQSISDTSEWIVMLSNPNGVFDGTLNDQKAFSKKAEYYGIEYGIYDNNIKHSDEVLSSIPEHEPDVFLGDIREAKQPYRYLISSADNTVIVENNLAGPKVLLAIYLKSAEIIEDPVRYNLYFSGTTAKFNEIFSRQLKNQNVTVSSFVNDQKVVIMLSGFGAEVVTVAKEYFKSLTDGRVRVDNFEIARQKLKNVYMEEVKRSPHLRLADVFFKGMTGGKTTESKLDDIEKYAGKEISVPRRFFLEVLGVGNIYFEELESLYNFIRDSYVAHPIRRPKSKWSEDVRRIEFRTDDKANKSVGMFYKVASVDEHGRDYSRRVGIGKLILQMSQKKFFDELRTKEQLGYAVYNKIELFQQHEYLIFVVQSVKEVEYLRRRLHRFIEELKKNIAEMDVEEFERYKKGVIAQEKKSVINYREHALKQHESGRMDLNSKVAASVLDVTKNDILESGILDFPICVSTI